MYAIRSYYALVPYDHIIVLVNSKKYGGGSIYNNFTICTTDHALSEQVFIHELGHGIAGLADEYYTSEVAFTNYYHLELEPRITSYNVCYTKLLRLLVKVIEYPCFTIQIQAPVRHSRESLAGAITTPVRLQFRLANRTQGMHSQAGGNQ